MLLYYSLNFSDYLKIWLIKFEKTNKIRKKITVWHKDRKWILPLLLSSYMKAMRPKEGSWEGKGNWRRLNSVQIICGTSTHIVSMSITLLKIVCFSTNFLNTRFWLLRSNNQMLSDLGEGLNFSEDLVLSRSEEWRGKSSLGWLPDFWLKWQLRKRRRKHPWGVWCGMVGISGQSAQRGKRDFFLEVVRELRISSCTSTWWRVTEQSCLFIFQMFHNEHILLYF